MNNEEAKIYAQNMTYRQAVYNMLNAKCVPYKKATRIKIQELIEKINILEREKGEWIPVSERLPEVGEDGLSEWVLVTLNSFGKIVTMYDRICHGGWLAEGFDGEEVLAWQPLPEPYKAESEE